MGSADRIERERLAKRSRILDAARELFLQRGVEAVTLREIAQRIEYSTTAIYVHFKDKASLVEAMLREDFEAFSGNLEAAAEVADPVARIAALFDAYLAFAMAMPRHYQLLFLTPSGAGHKHEGSPAGIEGFRVLLAAVEDCIRTGRFREEIRDAEAIAQVLWANVHGLVSLLIVLGDAPAFHWRPIDELARQSYDIMRLGLLRDPGERAPARDATRLREAARPRSAERPRSRSRR